MKYETVCEGFKLPDQVTRDGILRMATAKRDYLNAHGTVKRINELYTGMYSFLCGDDRQEMSEALDFLEHYNLNGIREKINFFTENVINTDREYFGKLESFGLPKDVLQYCL